MFDTRKTSYNLNSFILKQGGSAKDKILAVACMDDCVTELSEEAKNWLGSMGSEEIWRLEYGCCFAFIGHGGEGIEKRAREYAGRVSVSQIFRVNIAGKPR